MRSVLCAVIMLTGLTIAGTRAQEPAVAVFKSGVERVAIAATVRDSKGRLVKTLEARDFELLDSGRRRPLVGVWSEPSPASVAILMDASGSMATKMTRARETADLLVAGLKPGVDEVAFYTFDTTLQEVRPFSKKFGGIGDAWHATTPFGATSLWDAIAKTAQQISDRERRRAIVVITDGVDSASTLKPSDVSGIASSLDVPVYLLLITFALDDEQFESLDIRGPLADLAAWTGGDSLAIRDVEGAAAATAEILAELHHQYMIAFEPGSTPGWHPLVLRTKKQGLFVRARSGYIVK